MTNREATKYLKRAEKHGYVKYHSGFCTTECTKRYGGNTSGLTWGINIDGNGIDNLFGCPQIIWSSEEAEEKFPILIKTK